jgi:dTDP-4-dehydrorhamnose 3,5-epimerase
VIRGRAVFGLCDLRPGSPTAGLRTQVALAADQMQSLVIPPGVAHGFYFLEASMHVYSVSDYWDPEDELGCHFADPELALSWPTLTPRLSSRDEALPPLGRIIGRMPRWTEAAPAPQRPATPTADCEAAT